MSESVILRLKPGRAKPVRRRHPWIFSGAVADTTGEGAPGDVIRVATATGELLALAGWNPQSRIAARIWTWNLDERVDAEFIRGRLKKAIDRRRLKNQQLPPAVRLVHGESDGLPGLVVDWYAGVLVVQFLAWTVEAWRSEIVAALVTTMEPDSVYERSDSEARRLEGLEARQGLLSGDAVPDLHQIPEGRLHFWMDIAGGQKTGFFLDQRQNRSVVAGLAEGRRVLDIFAYTGAFGVSALAGGATNLLSVETSARAIEVGEKNVVLNGLNPAYATWISGDAFKVLRELRDRAQSFDLIVLDPPKFAPTASTVQRAARGYKDLNLLAFKLLTPGGVLATFSCSGGLSPELFQKIVADAALDAGRSASIVQRLAQPADHPVALNFPESAYLKGLICIAD